MSWYLEVFKKYAVFTGRARRKEYWMFYLFNSIATLILIAGTLASPGFGLVMGLYSLAALLPSLGVTVRRLHDTGRSGWFMFISLIPLIGGIVFFVVMVKDSHPGNNEYGPCPKEVVLV